MPKCFTHTKKKLQMCSFKEIQSLSFFSGFVLKSDDEIWTYKALSFLCKLLDSSSMNDTLTFWIVEVGVCLSVTVMKWLPASQSNIKTQNFMLSLFLIVIISHMPESSILIQFTQKTEVS